MSRIIGHGDYDLGPMPKRNSLVVGNLTAQSTFGYDGVHSFRVRRREFIKNIRSTGEDWSIDTVVCQPGLTEPFPYLSNIARNFTTYSVKGLVYEYVSNVSSFTSKPGLGAVILTFDPNQGADAFTNKIAMENTAGAVSARPDRNIVYGVECDESQKPYNQYFIRTGETERTATVAEDFGRFYIAGSGLSADNYPKGTLLGGLYVTYDIVFSTPRMPRLESGFFSENRLSGSSASPLGAVLGGTNAGGILYDVRVTNSQIQFWNVPVGSVFVVSVLWEENGVIIGPLRDSYHGLEPTAVWVRNGIATSIENVGYDNKEIRMDCYTVTNQLPDGYDCPTVVYSTDAANLDSTVMISIYTLGQGMSFAPL